MPHPTDPHIEFPGQELPEPQIPPGHPQPTEPPTTPTIPTPTPTPTPTPEPTPTPTPTPPGKPTVKNPQPTKHPKVPKLPEWPKFPGPTIIPKPNNTNKPEPQERSFTYNARGNRHRIIYGHVEKIGAGIAYWNALSTGQVLVRYIIGYGPISAISNITVDGKSVSSFGGTVEVFTGENNQAVSTLLTTYRTGWTQSRYPGIAHVVILFPSAASVDFTVDITRFQCDVDGLLIRDPIQDVTLATKYFSENPAFIIADLLVQKRFGGKYDVNRINWDLLANDTGPYHNTVLSNGAKRHTIGIVIDQEDELENVLENLRAHAQLFISYNTGKINIIADKPRTFSGITFTDDDLFEGATMRVRGSKEVFTHISVDFTDSANGWVSGVPVEAELPGVALGTAQYEAQSFSLLGLRTRELATRIAVYLLNRSIEDKEFIFKVKAIGAIVLPGDRVKITSKELNVTNLDIVITDCQPNGFVWTITAETYNAAIFADNIITETVVIPPTQLSPYATPPEISDIVMTASNGIDRPATVSFTWPQNRSTTTYPAGSWSSNGLLSTFTPASINDTLTNTTAVKWNNTSDGQLILDLGSAKHIREIEVTTSSAGYLGSLSLDWADTIGTWTNDILSFTSAARIVTNTDGTKTYLFLTAIAAAHRYLRIRKTNSSIADTTDYREVQVRELTGPYPYTERVDIYDRTDPTSGGGITANRKLITSVPYAALVSATSPINLGMIGGWTHYINPYNGARLATTSWLTLDFVVVNTNDVESLGLQKSALSTATPGSLSGSAPYVPQTDTAVALTNGDNGTIALPTGCGKVTFTGASVTSATIRGFSIDGATPAGGTILHFTNDTTGIIVFNHNDGAASAGFRLFSGGSVNFSVPAGGTGIWQYQSATGGSAIGSGIWVIAANPYGVGLYERGRSTPAGEWISFTPAFAPASGTYTGYGTVTAKYCLVGKKLTLQLKVIAGTLSVASNYIDLTIPGGFTSAVATEYVHRVSNPTSGSWQMAIQQVAASGTTLRFYYDLNAGVNFPTNASSAYLYFEGDIEIV
jgi:hypothetical protein